jgi:proteic killer suppression protein
MANHLGQVPPTKPIRRHQLSGARRGQFAVDLLHPYRLVFRPDHNPMPEKPDGGIDINAVNAIEIIEIIGYH